MAFELRNLNYPLDKLEVIFATILLLTISIDSIGQEFSPTLVVLTPFERDISDSLSAELRKYEVTQLSSPEYDKEILSAISLQGKQENETKMEYKEYLFRKNMNFYSMVSLGLSGFLTYRLYNYNSSCLIYPIQQESTLDNDAYLKIADNENVEWILNPYSVKTYFKEDQLITELRIQLYNRNEKKIILDNTYEGNSRNPGFEWACKEGSIDCTINNASAKAIEEILKEIR